MGLPEKLYMAWRSGQQDPSSVPSWGNLRAADREPWDQVERTARREVREMIATELGEAAVAAYGSEEADKLAFAAQRLRGKV